MPLPDIRQYPVLALDSETTGLAATDHAVGVSVWWGDGGFYARWGHQGGGNNCTESEAREWLSSLLPLNPILYMHNAPFDVRMIERGLGVDLSRCQVEDTGFMAALLNEHEPSFALGSLAIKYAEEKGKSDEALNQWCADKFGGKPIRKHQAKNYWRAPGTQVEQYAIDDARLTWELAHVLRPRITGAGLLRVYTLETSLIPILQRMNKAGVRVDVEGADAMLTRIRAELAELEEKWHRASGGVPYEGKGSKAEMESLWVSLGLPVSYTPTGRISLTKDVLESADHPVFNILKDIRRRQKMENTFLSQYILGSHVDGRVHAEFHPLRRENYGTISGRFSSSNPNLQNAPSPDKDTEYGQAFRGFFLPEPGCVWAKIDYSQIEYRLFAHYAQGAILQAYLDNPRADFHQICADMAGVPRSQAKNGNFAKLYGAGIGRLAVTLGISKAEAESWSAAYDEAIPDAAKLMNGVMRVADRRGWIKTWGERKVRFKRVGRRYDRTYKALNALLQGSAADIMKEALVRVDQVIDWKTSILHLTVHDEVDLSVPEGPEGEKVLLELKEVMEDFDTRVPMVADIETGPNWGAVEGWATTSPGSNGSD